MSFSTGDLGVLGRLAEALGIFKGGEPNPDWFGSPEESLKNMLANDDQRAALIAFVDEAMGGADRETDPRGVVWLPIVALKDPDLTIAVTVDDQPVEGLHVGVGILVRTGAPTSTSSLAIPLFLAKKEGGPAVGDALLLGARGGRIRIATSIAIDAGTPMPGQAHLGAIGLEVDLPTSDSDPDDPIFGFSLTDFQLPGATGPRNLRIAADGVDEIDDALLDLVLSLVKSQADAAPDHSPIAALGGLLGLRSGDDVPDFPIARLPVQGLQAIAVWLHGVFTTSDSRNDWIGHLADLLGGSPAGDDVAFDLGGSAQLAFGLRVDSGPTGNARLTPTLGVELGNDDARVEARADLFRIDLVTGTALALPALGVWAAAGSAVAAHRVLDVAAPTVARADTLRVGFALDGQRRLTFVLAADGVRLGTHDYATLDLTSPGAVMDAVGNTVGDVLMQLLNGCGDAVTVVRVLLGLNTPAGVAPVSLTLLMADPVGAVGGYWRDLVAAPAGAATSVLGALRNALADAGDVVTAIHGSGSSGDPWRVPLIGPLELELAATGSVLSVVLSATTHGDTLGQRCTVIDTRIAATIATLDLAARTARLLPGVEASLSGRERGVSPPRVTLTLDQLTTLTAAGVGLRLSWSPASGLVARVEAPNLTLNIGGQAVPIALPEIGADGTVALPPAAWQGVEALVGYLGPITGGFFGSVVAALGWNSALPSSGGPGSRPARLALADLVTDPATALATWLPRLAMSDMGPRALALLADLFAGSGAGHGLVEGSGHPDDPYRFATAAGLPELALWFPPEGLEPRLVAAPEAIRRWRPGDPGLDANALAAVLLAEATVAADVRALVDGRDVAAGLAALAQRWVGGDGRIVAPETAPAGLNIIRQGFAAGQLLGQLDLENVTGRVPSTTVYVAIGASAWATGVTVAPGRLVNLSAPGLDATMFAPPAAATGNWFVRLGGRADCKAADGASDGTREQADRLARVLDALANVSNDIALVAVAGAGHAARLAAEEQDKVTDLVMLGTPLGPISLTALSTQPTADALRLLHRLLPPELVRDPDDPDAVGEDADLALGRALVGALMELTERADPGADLRLPPVPAAAPRVGLAVSAIFGTVSDSRVDRAITAIVAAGLAERARIRAATPLPPATAVRAGLRLASAPSTTGGLSISGDALVTLFSYDTTVVAPSIDATPRLRVRLRVADRLGWLCATPDLELRLLSADISVPLDGKGSGESAIVLHDARVFGQSWERLVIGNVAGALPLLPEARTLLAAAAQRITADVAGGASVALSQLLTALGLVAAGGGVVADAVDQLVHDAGGLLRQRLAVAADAIGAAVATLLGPLGASVDLVRQSVRLHGGGGSSGRFGWHADVMATPAGVAGQVSFGPDTAASPAGRLNLIVDLDPLQAALRWQRPGGASDHIALWPSPDPAAIARAVARAAPSLGGHAALELLRRPDPVVRSVIDAVLDSFGLLQGAPGDSRRAIRPLAGLLADPAGWLRSADSLAASPSKIQGLFDALRPLLGIAGAPGTPIRLASGVALAVVADGPGARLSLDVDATAWTVPGAIAGRLAAGLGASLVVGPTGPPRPGLVVHVGLTGAATGRQAVHVHLGGAGIEVFMRPASGADIPLIPFAGLGSLAAAAEAALPFLLDQLAKQPGTAGALVEKLGDALALRAGAPRRFDGAALHAWAVDPVAALTTAVPSIVATGLATIAPLLDAFVPTAVAVTATSNLLSVKVADFTLSWGPASGVVSLEGDGIAVPGIEQVSFTVAISAAGLDELSVTAGPAAIDAGGVTLRPFVTVAAGLAPAGGRRVAVGMAFDDTHRFGARWLLDSHQFDLVASDGLVASAVDTTDPVQVALRIVEAVADLAMAVAIVRPSVTALLDSKVSTKPGAITVRNLVRGVVLRDVDDPAEVIGGLFDPATLLARIHRLFGNLAGAGISIAIDGFTIAFTKIDGIVGIEAGLAKRFTLIDKDVVLWLENDDSWIEGNPPGDGGLFVGFLPDTLPLRFTPSLTVNGLGLRFGKSSGPLLDAGISLESIALHAYAAIAAGGAHSGGVRLQFTNLAVLTGGAQGHNGIAQGIMRDSGPTPPKPAFSPALAVQKHGNKPVAVTLSAGDPPGPWWIAIQKGFGPLYLEQIGFNAIMPQGRVERVSLLMDGSVSMFGLSCAVDDLQITYLTARGDFFNPANWQVDLAGLAVSADMAGVSIAGGLLKQVTNVGLENEQIEYLGMLLGRFGVYGLTVYGGYGEGRDDHNQKFTAFFAVGAVNGPIGGPPAFFLTGIGGGIGINRLMRLPTDLAKFGDYPLIQALDIAAKPGDPMTQLRALGEYFPMRKGSFWFAAGLSFTSFALVNGIAVVGVQVGDGLDINLLGLARMALPRPQVALVSIELALLVRFSSSEGVLWVQGQLTDNSWLLYPDVKLTGGFAYVIWFKGAHRGEFVLTLGGYHPDFHRDGYPVVPRLGLRWSIGNAIVIKSGSYFALTSEALMTGGDFEASAHFGPAWAEVKFGAHGIVYFDPFHYHVNAYARIAAGVTIDTWIFGEVTISISLGARIDVTGPDFHGSATFEVGPIELTVEFGGSDQAQKTAIGESAFIAKYLEAGAGGAARAHALLTSFGAQPAKGEDSTPDGSAARPFIVVAEFGMTFTSTVPATHVTRVQAPVDETTAHAPSRAIGVAPMGVSDRQPTIKLTWTRSGVRDFPFVATARPFGRFPVGVWGAPQDPNNRKVPQGNMIKALNELDLVCRATPSVGGPEIPYYQVATGKRKSLPFTRDATAARAVKDQAKAVARLVAEPATASEAFRKASAYLTSTASPTALAALRGERQAPPLLGTLAEGLVDTAPTVIPQIGAKAPGEVYDHFVDPPVAVGLLDGAGIDLRITTTARTTVGDAARAWRTAPPTLASVEARRSHSIAARLVVVDTPVASTGRGGTMIGVGAVPPTAVARAAPALVARTGAAGGEHLAAFSASLAAGQRAARVARDTAGTAGATLTPGQIVVLKMPNAQADTSFDIDRPRLAVVGAPARLVLLGHGGKLLADRLVGADQGDPDGASIEIRRGTERIVAIGQGMRREATADAGLIGWHAGMRMPYAGWSTAVAPGCVVRSSGESLPAHRERLDAGWVGGAELACGVSTVVTTFASAVTTVVVVLDDPAAFGDSAGGRQLLLGLEGADRRQDGLGRDRLPVLLTMENRSVLAYEIVPEGHGPVVVTIASETGWSLVGVMGSADLDATGAIALISARGLDAAIRPFAAGQAAPGDRCQLHWLGPTRTAVERQRARILAGQLPAAPPARAVLAANRSARSSRGGRC